jgi:hypothetical protein
LPVEHGTVAYLVVQAHANPVAFMSLLGKVLPMTLTSGTEKDDAPTKIITEVVWPIGPDGKRVYPSWWKQSDRVDASIISSADDDSLVVESRVVSPEDKDGNIIDPSWWVDEPTVQGQSRAECAASAE